MECSNISWRKNMKEDKWFSRLQFIVKLHVTSRVLWEQVRIGLLPSVHLYKVTKPPKMSFIWNNVIHKIWLHSANIFFFSFLGAEKDFKCLSAINFMVLWKYSFIWKKLKKTYFEHLMTMSFSCFTTETRQTFSCFSLKLYQD